MGEAVPSNKIINLRRGIGLRRAAIFGAGVAVFLAVAVLFLRPYSRLEHIAGEALLRHAPSGTTVNGISVTFPLNIALTNLTVPIEMQGRRQKIEIKELSGKISVLSLLFGELELGMNSDFFGGTLWLDVNTKTSSAGGSSESSHVAFDARAREVDISELAEFLEADVEVKGICDADVEGDLDNDDLARLNGRAIAIGRDIYVPAIDLGSIILPENSDVELKSKLSAKDGKIVVNKLRVKGMAYDLSGTGTIYLSDPLEQSALDGSFSIVFKESPIVGDKSLVNMGAEYVLDALVESGAEVYFKLSGTARSPELELDPSSSIGSLLRNSSR